MKIEIKTKKTLKIILIICVICFCLFYLRLKVTYTSYESKITGNIDSKIANWNITINNETITEKISKTINLGDISWENKHANPSKVAPSSIGKLNLIIDPTTTSVAIKYEIKITDKNINKDKLLTVNNITDNTSSIIKTSSDTYTGLITLSEIKNNQKKTATINLEWKNDDTINDLENNSTDFVTIEFTAFQYKGEKIIAYQE